MSSKKVEDLAAVFGVFPTCFCSLSRDLGTLRFGHGLEATLAADLTAFATDGGHILGDIGWRSAPGHLGNFRL